MGMNDEYNQWLDASLGRLGRQVLDTLALPG